MNDSILFDTSQALVFHGVDLCFFFSGLDCGGVSACSDIARASPGTAPEAEDELRYGAFA